MVSRAVDYSLLTETTYKLILKSTHSLFVVYIHNIHNT